MKNQNHIICRSVDESGAARRYGCQNIRIFFRVCIDTKAVKTFEICGNAGGGSSVLGKVFG